MGWVHLCVGLVWIGLGLLLNKIKTITDWVRLGEASTSEIFVQIGDEKG